MRHSHKHPIALICFLVMILLVPQTSHADELSPVRRALMGATSRFESLIKKNPYNGRMLPAETERLETYLYGQGLLKQTPDATYDTATVVAVKQLQIKLGVMPTGYFFGTWRPRDPRMMPPSGGYVPTACDADFNHDGIVSIADLLLFIPAFGTSGASLLQDINHDGIVAVSDLILFIDLYGSYATDCHRFVTMGAGSTTCGVLDTSEAYCWGHNTTGATGTGSTAPTITLPAIVSMETSGGLANTFAKVQGGRQSDQNASCGMHTSGELLCWGANNVGQLGLGITGPLMPTPIVATSIGGQVIDFDTNGATVCAIKPNLNLYCWGANTYGQVGTGSPTSHIATPYHVQLPKGVMVQEVSVGDLQTCALTTDGRVFCWGSNQYGQIGLTASAWATYGPQQIAFGTGVTDDFVDVASGYGTACAVHASGGMYCWGNNAQNILVGVDSNISPIPQYIAPVLDGTATPAWKHVSMGNTGSVCGIQTSGKMFCWGGGAGSGTGSSEWAMVIPLPVSTQSMTAGNAIAEVSMGFGGGCVINSISMRTYCWGSNYWGEVGSTNASVMQTVPLEVMTAGID
jgi:hypothetical protein